MNDYSKVSITWRGDISSIHGHSQHARSIIKPLIKGGASVRLENINLFNKAPADLDTWWVDRLKDAQRVPPGRMKIWHCDPPQGQKEQEGVYKKNIVYTRWDTWKVPRSWIQHINNKYDELWTTNAFCITGDRASEVKIPKKSFPAGISWDYYSKMKERAKIVGIPDDHVILGTTAAWNNKENLTDLITGFCCEFHKTIDPVTLVIKIDPANPGDPNEKSRILNLIKEIKGSIGREGLPQIVVIQDVLSQHGMDKIINAFDIYVSSARGKSKNLTLLKCIAQNKACVAVHTTMHSDLFQDHEQGYSFYPVNYVLEPALKMTPMYNSADLWARPDLGHLMYQMRSAFRDFYTPTASNLAKEMSEKVSKRYDSSIVLNKMAKLLESKQEIASEIVL
jgi:hypothetical protein